MKKEFKHKILDAKVLKTEKDAEELLKEGFDKDTGKFPEKEFNLRVNPNIKTVEEEIKEMKTKIKCPTCNSTFDISNYVDAIKNQFINKMEKVMKEIKEGK